MPQAITIWQEPISRSLVPAKFTDGAKRFAPTAGKVSWWHWALLQVINALRSAPGFKVAFELHARKQRRISELQDRCIAKKQREDIVNALRETADLCASHRIYLRAIEGMNIPDWRKTQIAHDDFVWNCNFVQRKRATLISDLVETYKYFKYEIKSERILREVLSEPEGY